MHGQTQEESLLWNDTPSLPIEDQIAATVQGTHPLQTGFQEQTRQRVVAPARTHGFDLPAPGANQLPPGSYRPVELDDRYRANNFGFITEPPPAGRPVPQRMVEAAFVGPSANVAEIQCATEIFCRYLELMAIGQMNRNIPAAIHEAVKNAKYLISLTGSK